MASEGTVLLHKALHAHVFERSLLGDDEGVAVSSVARNGPAQKAGVQEGDRIMAVAGTRVADLAGLWRAVWACGNAGARVRLTVGRSGGAPGRDLVVTSIDRRSFLKAPRLH